MFVLYFQFSKSSKLNLESLYYKKNPWKLSKGQSFSQSVGFKLLSLLLQALLSDSKQDVFLQSLLMINELLMYLLYLVSLFKTHVYTSRLSRDSYLFKKTVLKVYIINHVEAYWVRVTWIVELKVGDQLRSCRQRIQ